MSSTTHDVSVGAARAEALFASALQPSDALSGRQVRRAIAAAIAAYRSSRPSAIAAAVAC